MFLNSFDLFLFLFCFCWYKNFMRWYVQIWKLLRKNLPFLLIRLVLMVRLVLMIVIWQYMSMDYCWLMSFWSITHDCIGLYFLLLGIWKASVAKLIIHIQCIKMTSNSFFRWQKQQNVERVSMVWTISAHENFSLF